MMPHALEAIDHFVSLGFSRTVGEEYAKRVLDHIIYVQEAGRRLGVDEAQLLSHDASKWSPEEFPGYALHFCGGGQPMRFAKAWNHHIHQNPHHWQYYLFADGFDLPGSGIIDGALMMLDNYALEMVADWMGASRAYTGSWDMSEWLDKNWAKIRLHPASRIYVADVLTEQGYTVESRSRGSHLYSEDR